MKDSDFIFEDTVNEVKGEFSEGDTVVINGSNFTISKFIKAKQVGDKLGFPAIYSWYKATNEEGSEANLFFFDSDIDCVENNDKVAEKWWEDYQLTV